MVSIVERLTAARTAALALAETAVGSVVQACRANMPVDNAVQGPPPLEEGTPDETKETNLKKVAGRYYYSGKLYSIDKFPAIKIEGSDEFRNNVLYDMRMLAKTDSGKSIFKALHKANKENGYVLTIKESFFAKDACHFATGAKSAEAKRRLDAAGNMVDGAGTEASTILYRADRGMTVTIKGIDLDFPSEKVLGHEMIHAVHAAQGKIGIKKDTETYNVAEEHATVGLDRMHVVTAAETSDGNKTRTNDDIVEAISKSYYGKSGYEDVVKKANRIGTEAPLAAGTPLWMPPETGTTSMTENQLRVDQDMPIRPGYSASNVVVYKENAKP